MKAPTLSPREQRLALAAGMVLVVWGVVSWIGLPLWDRVRQLGQRTPLSQRKLERLQEVVSRQSQIEQAYQAQAIYRSAESDEALHSAFLSKLEELANGTGLKLGLKPKPVQRDGLLNRFGVELEIDATQEALLSFLDHLLMQPALMELETLRISATTSKEYPLRATLLVNRVAVRARSE